MLRREDVVVICCFFLGVGPLHGKILPPQNVTLSWPDGFEPLLTWSPPPHTVENCKYEVSGNSEIFPDVSDTFLIYPQELDGGCLDLSVKAVCGNEESDSVPIPCYPDLVKDFECYVESSKRTYCNWNNTTNTTDLRFYYRLIPDDGSVSINDPLPTLQECPSYRHTGSVKTGCDLQTRVLQKMNILFNGTLDKKPVTNTFGKSLIYHVKPLPLKWTVTKDKDKFSINWVPPDILDLDDWDFVINYTECVEQKNTTVNGKTFHRLPYVPHCAYRMSIRAKFLESLSPWSEWKYFKAETDHSPMVYAAIIIPLVFAGLAVLMFVCCRQNKDKLFPDVPVPEDLLSGISDNNNKSTFHDLFIPAEKEELCTVTLVTDLESDKTSS